MEEGKRGRKWATLPISRVSTIMRSAPDISSISPDAIVIIGKSAELFLQYLSQSVYDSCDDPSKLTYNDIARIVVENPQFAFLTDMIPRKIKVREYREIISGLQEASKIENINNTK